MTQPPGFLTLTADEYHGDTFADGQPNLSAGICSILVNSSPAHAKAAHPRLNADFKPREEDAFDIGTVAHALMLQGERQAEDIVEVVCAEDWRTKIAKEAKADARAAGRIPLLSKHWAGVEAMVEAGREQLAAFDLSPRAFENGKPEQTITWTEPNGVCCKARIDWLHDDLSAVDDYKTTSRSANPETWTRNTMYSIGADMQVAFYLRGLEALTGKRPEWRYVVQETFPPYALAVVSLGPDVLELANAKVDYAIEKWASCLGSGEWPAYPTRVCWAEAPAWELSRWLEREAREEMRV